MSHITGSCVVFYFFYRFLSGKFIYFTRPPPVLCTFNRIYWRFVLPFIPNGLRFYKHTTILSG